MIKNLWCSSLNRVSINSEFREISRWTGNRNFSDLRYVTQNFFSPISKWKPDISWTIFRNSRMSRKKSGFLFHKPENFKFSFCKPEKIFRFRNINWKMSRFHSVHRKHFQVYIRKPEWPNINLCSKLKICFSIIVNIGSSLTKTASFIQTII